MQNRRLLCQKCNKKIPIHSYKIHSKHCKGRCPVHPMLAELFLSRIHLFIQITKMKQTKQEIICRHCEHKLQSKRPQDHVFECSNISVNCPYCQHPTPAKLINSHLQTCLLQFTQSYITMKENTCCQKLRDTAVMSTEMESLIERLMADLHIPATKTQRSAEKQIGTKVRFTQGICQKSCREFQECSFCLVDFLNKEEVKRVQCGHMFHHDCLELWRRKASRCLSCKTAFD